MLTRWLAAFALTQAVEVPVILRAQAGRPWPRRLFVSFGGSALTHPIVWFVAPRVVPGGWVAMAIVAEVFAVLAETAWLRAFGVPRAFWWSLLANALSAGIGLSIRAEFGWP